MFGFTFAFALQQVGINMPAVYYLHWIQIHLILHNKKKMVFQCNAIGLIKLSINYYT